MLLDIHTHLDSYKDDLLEKSLKQIETNKILSISNSMDYPSYKKNCEIAEKCRYVIPIFGIHPWNAPHYCDKLDSIKKYIEESFMIGEIGLDYHFIKDSQQQLAQQKVFEFFLNEAKRMNKLVIVHTKGAEEDVLRMLNHYDIQRAIIHWYSGPIEIFREMREKNYYFTVGFMVSHSDFIRIMARRLPQWQILTETDNPGGMQWFSNEPGMPVLINSIVSEIARVRNKNKEEISNTIWDNFMNMLTYEERSFVLSRIKANPHLPVVIDSLMNEEFSIS